MKKLKNKRKKIKIIVNHEKCKMKQNNKNYKKNRKNKHEHYWLLRINNVQWNENVRIQDYARNELTTAT